MELTERIAGLLEEKFASDEAFSDCFIVEIELKPGNRLSVFLDADGAFTFERCQKLSRYLESHLDTNGWLTEKYVLEVSSPGVNRPLKFARQFIKNVGRNFEVTLFDKSQYAGKMTEADAEKIKIEYEVKEKEGKKNVKRIIQKEIPYDQIEKAIVKITFKEL